MSTFGKNLIESARQALAIAEGKMQPARVFVPENVDVQALRKRMRLSQAAFAEQFGLSAAALKDWEQGRRRPDRTARALLAVIDHAPDTVREALKKAG